MERFIKDVESVMKYRGDENVTHDMDDHGGSSDMDFGMNFLSLTSDGLYFYRICLIAIF